MGYLRARHFSAPLLEANGVVDVVDDQSHFTLVRWRQGGEDLEQGRHIDGSRLPDCLCIDDVVMMNEPA